MASVDRTDFIPLFEGGLDEAKSAAGHLKAAGIEFDIGMTDGSNPGSWSCCYVLAVASQDLETAQGILTAKKAERAKKLHQEQLAAKAKAKKKSKSAAKARKKRRK
jgi:bisphosphoglycerate-dependent phosphoglycerate mutase